MAKLEIKLSDEAKERKEKHQIAGMAMRDYDILIDGREINHMTGIEIGIGADEINHATLKFFIDDLTLDGDFLSLVKAEAEKK